MNIISTRIVEVLATHTQMGRVTVWDTVKGYLECGPRLPTCALRLAKIWKRMFPRCQIGGTNCGMKP
eukprot:11215275-Lingulodinium_polyedra.AAC.1